MGGGGGGGIQGSSRVQSCGLGVFTVWGLGPQYLSQGYSRRLLETQKGRSLGVGGGMGGTGAWKTPNPKRSHTMQGPLHHRAEVDMRGKNPYALKPRPPNRKVELGF